MSYSVDTKPPFGIFTIGLKKRGLGIAGHGIPTWMLILALNNCPKKLMGWTSRSETTASAAGELIGVFSTTYKMLHNGRKQNTPCI